MHIHQPGGGKLGAVIGEGGVESTLMVVIAIGGWRVLPTNIDDGVAGGEEGGIAGAEEAGWGVCGEETQEIDG